MKRIYYYIGTLFFVCMLCSCLDDVILILPDNEPKLVIYGWINNLNEPYSIAISKSNNFNQTAKYSIVSGAYVYVTDRVGKKYFFIENPNNGQYESKPSEFVGVRGQKYELHVKIPTEGDSIYYKSLPEELKLNSELGTVSISNLSQEQGGAIKNDSYYVSSFINDTPKINNYYRWKLEVNQHLRVVPSELVIFSDKITDGNSFVFHADNVLFSKTDKVRLFHMSLSPTAFKYFSQLKDLTGTSVVGPSFQAFDLKGNLFNVNDQSEVVHGFFGASDIRIVEVTK